MEGAREDAWGESAKEYDTFEKRWHFYGTVADATIAQLRIEERSRVLELACGTGACTLKLANLAGTGKVVALDSSGGMLGVARENASVAGAHNVTFVQGDAREISGLLAGQTFDFAVCNSAFWHFPEPERVLVGLRELLTEAGAFALSLPSWVEGNEEVREALRAKTREVLLEHGVPPDAIDAFALRRVRQRVDYHALFRRLGFAVKDVPFEFEVSRESREAWRRIGVFSGNRRLSRLSQVLDPAVQRDVRAQLDSWRKANFPRDPGVSRWRIYVGHRSGQRSEA